MKDQRDTLFRLIALLELIPRAPRYKATTTLQMALHEKGYMVEMRTLQRDLEKLSNHFPLICNTESKPYRWSFDRDFKSNLPALDVPSALTWVLAQEYLKGLLPKVAVDQLQNQFDQARSFLDGQKGNALAHWSKQVKAIPAGKALKPAEVDDHIWQSVSDALLLAQPLAVDYLSKQKNGMHSYILHPLGLVMRHSVSYLLALVNDYDDVRQFALHRIQKVQPIESVTYRGHADFSIDDYVQAGSFGYPIDDTVVDLVALVSPEVAWMLSETPLTDQQTLSEALDDGWCKLTAQVPNDQQTLWWLQGFGANIDVLHPQAWRDNLAAQAQKILTRYNS